MISKDIVWFGQAAVLSCDAKCDKAWGLNSRPRIEFDPEDPDDYAFLADDELGEAPYDPGTYEGGHAKPRSKKDRLNKWCARECERSCIVGRLNPDDKPSDFSRRVYNMHSREVIETQKENDA